MADVYWEGQSTPEAQQDTGSIDTVDGTPSDNDFEVDINGDIVSVPGDTDVSTTAANLVAALNGSTNPYFSAITWSNPSGGDIVAVATDPGMPFTATLQVSGVGTGTVTDFANDTPSSGPNHWDTAENWDTGSVPVAGDDVYIRDSAINILWGLDQAAVDLNSLTIHKTYTGKIGLDYKVCVTNADGSTFSTLKPEYRDLYLKIESDKVDFGFHEGPGDPAGSQRILWDGNVHSAQVTVHDTAANSSEVGRPALRIKAVNATTDLFVRRAPGGVGIASEVPGEVSTLGDITISDNTPASLVSTGPGLTLTNWTQSGGNNVLHTNATLTTLMLKGGTLRTEGDFTITLLTITNGTLIQNNIKTGGAAITTALLNGGTVDASQSSKARTWTLALLAVGCTIKVDGAAVTITTLTDPTGLYTMTLT